MDLRQAVKRLECIGAFELALERERRSWMLEQARNRRLEGGAVPGDVLGGVAERPSAANNFLGRDAFARRGQTFQRFWRRRGRMPSAAGGAPQRQGKWLSPVAQ